MSSDVQSPGYNVILVLAEQASLLSILPQHLLYKTQDAADVHLVTTYWAETCACAPNSTPCTRAGCNAGDKVPGLDCRRRDVFRLKDCIWLNDEVINSFVVLLNARHRLLEADTLGFPTTRFVNCFFYSKLRE